MLDTRMCNNSRFWNGGLVDSMLCLKAGSKSQGPCKVKRMAWSLVWAAAQAGL